MENNKNKVEVLISQERYDELLQKEKQLAIEVAKRTIRLSYKYLDLRHYMNWVDPDKDTLFLIYSMGEDIPQELVEKIEGVKDLLLERINSVNQHRLDKIEEAKAEIRQDIQERKNRGMGIPFMIREWLGLGKHPEDNA